MTAIRQAAQATPGGPLLINLTDAVSVWKHDGDALLSSTIDTDAEGFWSYTYTPEGSAATQWILNPGPLYWAFVYGSQVRRGSTKAAMMAGANSLLELSILFQGIGNGVVVGGVAGDFLVTYDGTGLDLDVAAGYAVNAGVGITNPASRKINLGAAHATLPRIDTVVLETTTTPGDTEGKTVLKVVAGTAATTPVAPTLTATQTPLADARLNAAQTNIATVTDRRVSIATDTTRNPTVLETVAISGFVTISTTITTTPTTVAGLQVAPTLLNGVVYDVFIKGSVMMAGTSASLPVLNTFINGTTNVGIPVTGPASTDPVTLVAASSLAILGSGASITCGVLVSKTTAAAIVSHYGGSVSLTAVPRS